MLLALIWKFHFSPFMVLVISVLNDGTIMTISKDIVKPSTLPDSWKLQEIFATAQQLHMAYEKKSNTEMDADDQRRLGRGKIEIKRIENTTNRQVTFCKRRNSVRETIERYKKACADTSTNGSASEITAQHYQQESAKLRNQIKTLQNSNKGYMGEGLSNIPVKDLKGMETKLEKAITRIRSKKVYLATGKLEKAITRIRSKKVYLATGIVEGIWEAVSKYTTKTCGNKGYTYKRWPYW